MSNQLTVSTTDAAGCCAPIAQMPLPADHAARLAKAYKALGDPARLQLLSLIASHPGGEACVCDITAGFELTGATISHHLKVLREAGLIAGERRGTWVYYRPVREAITELSTLLVLPQQATAPAS